MKRWVLLRKVKKSLSLVKLMNGMPREQPATVFCDFDGPLVDVSARYYSTYRLALANVCEYYNTDNLLISITPLSQEQFWQMKRNRVPDIEIAGKSGIPPAAIDPFLAQVSYIVNHNDLLYQDTIQPGVSWALNLLRSEGIELVLVTLRAQEQAEQILAKANLLHLFSGVFGTHSNEDVAYVNSIELKTQLLKNAAAVHWPVNIRDRKTACTIGDTEADVWAGRNLGIETIALTCGIRSQEYLQKQSPSVILEDLVSASNYLVRSKVACA
jgi:phosphoglycolate phosphatase